MREPKRLTAEERIYAGQLFGRVVETAADDPLDTAERLGRALLDHIAWQEGEIARLKADLEGANRFKADEGYSDDRLFPCGKKAAGVKDEEIARLEAERDFWERRDEKTAEALAEFSGIPIVADMADDALAGYVRAIVGDSNADLLAAGERENALREALAEMVIAMRRYEMDVDAAAPETHKQMMQRVHAALDTPPSVYAQQAQKRFEERLAERERFRTVSEKLLDNVKEKHDAKVQC